MRAEQTVNEMAEEILSRQARALAKQTEEPFVEALEAVLETPAGHQLEELRGGPDTLGEDLVRMASETLQPGHVTFCRGPITTLNPSRNVATPPSPPGGIIVKYFTKC